MSDALPPTTEYRCPGEAYPISRAVHLGRMARFYPGCRQCAFRDDTGALSARQVQQLTETRPRGVRPPLLHDEGAGGVDLNDLGPSEARDLAAALGIFVQSDQPTASVVVGGDGRPMTAGVVAAVGEGLRWAGCDLVDIGPATAACLTFAIDHLGAAGGILVGSPGERPHTIGLKFWAPGPRPLSAGEPMHRLRRIYEAAAERPGRAYGSLCRFQAEVPYLAEFSGHYHALRPLRLILAASSLPLAGYLAKLTAGLACQIIPCRSTREGLPGQVLADNAHFAARIDDDGETCHVLDEQGRPVAAERLLLLIAGHLTAENPQGVVVLEEAAPPNLSAAVRAAGYRVQEGGVRRAEMDQAMRQHAAVLGGGPTGRFWHRVGKLALPDALMTLTLLLVILSRSDRRLSEVLDDEAALN